MGVRIPTDPIKKVPFIGYQIESWAGKTSDRGRGLVIAALGYELARLILKIRDEELTLPILFPWNEGTPSTTVLCEQVIDLAPDYGRYEAEVIRLATELATRVCDWDRES